MTLFGIEAAAFMFPVLFALVFLGVPVAFSLIATSLIFGFGVFGGNIGLQMHGRTLDVSSNLVLSAIPLFVFMGAMLERSGIAERLLEAALVFLGRLRGGLAYAALALCTVFAATSGIVGAVEVTVGLMAMPAMMKLRYSNSLIAGIICAGGSLGTIIPPTILVVVYASVADLSVGDMFAGVLIPGALMVAFFTVTILIWATLDPKAAPAPPEPETRRTAGEAAWLVLTAMVPCVILIFCVLGSIFLGIASPTEAAALGAAGAMILALVYNRLNWRTFVQVLKETVTVTAMIMLIVAGGVMFSSIFIVNGGSALVRTFIADAELGQAGLLLLVLGIIVVMGFVLDWISVVLIAIPILDPVVRAAGIDPIWFGVMVCVALQTSYLTPPIAPALFYLRSIAPPEMTYGQMYRGVAPFVVAQLAVLLIVALVPATATWLPEILFGGF